jgi:hypothetical protein
MGTPGAHTTVGGPALIEVGAQDSVSRIRVVVPRRVSKKALHLATRMDEGSSYAERKNKRTHLGKQPAKCTSSMAFVSTFFFSGWRTCGLEVFFTGSVAALGFARASAGLRSSRTPLCKQRPRLGSETISPAFGAVSGNRIRLPSACCSQKDPCLMQLNLTVDVLCSYQCKL